MQRNKKGQFLKGHTTSKNIRIKISKTKSGQKYGPCPMERKLKIGKANKGRLPWNTGKTRPPFSKEWRINLSIAHANQRPSKEHIEKLTGKNNLNWQGGISFEPYAPEFNKQFKELIRLRDGYKCQKCGCPEIENNEKLTIHHIDYIKKNCKPENLISLCKSCNGKVNFNREYWTKYFQKKIKEIMNSSMNQLSFRFIKSKKNKGHKVRKGGNKDVRTNTQNQCVSTSIAQASNSNCRSYLYDSFLILHREKTPTGDFS